MKKKISYIIVGLIIISIGVTYAGDILDFWDVKFSFAGWWALFIIIPAFVSMISGGINMFNVIVSGIGILLFVGAQQILPNNAGYKLIFPYVIIVIGLFITLKRTRKPTEKGNNGLFSGSSGENFFAVFGGNTPQLDGVDFRGAKAFAIFGGVELYMQNTIIKRDCAIEVYSIFGGTDIVLPKNVHVSITSIPIFGGVDNTFVSDVEKGNAPTVYIRALSIFGGTDIR